MPGGNMVQGLLFALLASVIAHSVQAAIPAPQDRAYPGVIALRVDATDFERRILSVHERIPVQPGPIILLYPQWLPGKHAPRGRSDNLAGLMIEAGGKSLAWRRDPLNVFAFHLDVPKGVKALDVHFQVATPQNPDADHVIPTAALMGLQWNQVVLYPAGYYARGITVSPQVRFPPQWTQASALTARTSGEVIEFEPVSLEVLVDSPVFAGRHAARLDLSPTPAVPVHLNVFADNPADLAATAEQVALHRSMLRQAYAAFGPPAFDHYDFLLALSDNFGGIGLEHHRSSENSHSPGYFRAWDEAVSNRALLAHEFTHAWNGKHRRPAALWTPQYNVPMQDSLLWIYEGMTEYYGMLLTARSGLWSPEFTRDAIAAVAAVYERKRPGRAWRPLGDTANQPIMNPRRALPWVSWQRTEDYYTESVLLWLDVDTRLRELSGGDRSLDNVAHAFFGARPNQGKVATYILDDLVKSLTQVGKADWKAFFARQVDGVSPPLLEGLTRSGWRLVFSDKPNAFIRDAEKSRKVTDLSYSLGMIVGANALLTEVVWDGPAFKAGLTTSTTLVAVDGHAYSTELLKDVITQAKVSHSEDRLSRWVGLSAIGADRRVGGSVGGGASCQAVVRK
jgi:predicted metalloprotease with PDZ domain